MDGRGPGAIDDRPPWRRIVLVAVPWLLAGGLAVLGIVRAGNDLVGADEVAAPAPSSPAAPSPGLASPTPDTSPPTGSPPSRDAVQLPPGVRLAVLAAARATLGTAGLDGQGGPPDRWPVEVRIATVDAVTADLGVATVHGLVIEVEDETWRGPRPRAVAVPLRFSPTPAVAGPGWPLADPELPHATAPATPVAEADAAVVDVLQQGGWEVAAVSSVGLVDHALLEVALRGTAPGGSPTSDHTVWLLDAPGGPRLLPLSAHDQPEDTP